MPDRWGEQFHLPKGYIARLGEGEYQHWFGGDRIVIDCPYSEPPTLLMMLDLADPKLSSIHLGEIDRLPLCSYINTNGWEKRQIYKIAASDRVTWLRVEIPMTPLEDEFRFPHPLPERPLVLHDMSPDDYPTNQEQYHEAFDEFMGGDSWIRVLGPPLWIDCIEEHCHECGKTMDYIAALGYEVFPSGVLIDVPFFIGEGALYFFLCSSCHIISVQSQGT